MGKTDAKKVPSTISSKELYSIGELRQRLGIGVFWMLRARWRGLKVLRISRKKFVLGKDFIEYLEAAHATPKPRPAGCSRSKRRSPKDGPRYLTIEGPHH